AAALAVALGAAKLVVLTDVAGLYAGWPGDGRPADADGAGRLGDVDGAGQPGDADGAGRLGDVDGAGQPGDADGVGAGQPGDVISTLTATDPERPLPGRTSGMNPKQQAGRRAGRGGPPQAD